MRPIEDIHGDYWDVATLDGSTQELEAATINLVKDIPDLLTALAEKDAEIERLRNIARLAGNLTDRLAEINLATDNARAIAAAMQYGKETAALAEALTEVGE